MKYTQNRRSRSTGVRPLEEGNPGTSLVKVNKHTNTEREGKREGRERERDPKSLRA